MAVFLESPVPVICIGIAVEVVLAIVLLRTGRGRLLWAMLAAGVFVLLGLLIERLVVTNREAIEHTLVAAVGAVEANDLDRLLDCISPRARQARADARWVLGRVEVHSAHIRDLEITVDRRTSPPVAKARFLAVGTGRDRRGEFPYDTYMRRVVVDLRPEGGRWLITGYDVEDLHPPRP